MSKRPVLPMWVPSWLNWVTCVPCGNLTTRAERATRSNPGTHRHVDQWSLRLNPPGFRPGKLCGPHSSTCRPITYMWTIWLGLTLTFFFRFWFVCIFCFALLPPRILMNWTELHSGPNRYRLLFTVLSSVIHSNTGPRSDWTVFIPDFPPETTQSGI